MSKQHFDTSYGLTAPENYERTFVPAIGRPLAIDLIGSAALHPGERVLDVACGTGIVARLAAKQVGGDGTVAGLDINPGMLAVARSIASEDISIEWYEAGAEEIPLKNESFDVVTCQLSLQFMEDKSTALKEMHRVLVPGGRIVLNVPGPAGELFRIFVEELKQHISPEAAGFANHVFSLHDTSEIRKLMSDAGFRNIDVQASKKTLHLPAPQEFLWQYVHSTPLRNILAEADEKAKKALEHEVVKKWQTFEKNGTLLYQQRIVTAKGIKK